VASGWEGIAQDFSDLPSLGQAAQVLVRLGMATVLGGALGFEREWFHKSAGMRTHMLIATAAALFVLLPQGAGMHQDALSRVIQGVLAGVGFLGGGAILRSQDQTHVKGLTTAADIWFTTAVGIAAGLGQLTTAILATLLGLLVLFVLGRLEGQVEKARGKKDENKGG
jgi:putative Mg2+ transporter-C (MgtC) family protein